jgi:hypothetical protein
MTSADRDLAMFETGALDPAEFPHSEHLRLAFEMLARCEFGEAVMRFSRALKLLAARSGKPDIYHETITVAFLALVGERRAVGDAQNWQAFRAGNSDLLDKNCLSAWYSRDQLESESARRTFCLPWRVAPRDDGRAAPAVFAVSSLAVQSLNASDTLSKKEI